MKNKVKPDHVEKIAIPRKILNRTWRYLSKRGKIQLEGVAYWTGSADSSGGAIKHVIFPKSYEEESNIHLEISDFEVMRLTQKIQDFDEFLLARVHSHPTAAYHSPSDDRGCLSGRIGMISIVIPDFAKSSPDITKAAIYERLSVGTWRQISEKEIEERFLVV
jgi:hypothetical protein